MHIGEQSVTGFIDSLAGEHPTPAAGSALAATMALAAALIQKCARKAVGRVENAESVLADAEGWGRRALELADEDAASFEAVLVARRQGAPHAAVAKAADPPLEVAALGAEIAAAAADLAGRGKPWLRGDAHSAALLAEGATRAAVALAGIDLAEARVSDADERRDRARWLAAAAGESRTRAEAAVARSRR